MSECRLLLITANSFQHQGQKPRTQKPLCGELNMSACSQVWAGRSCSQVPDQPGDAMSSQSYLPSCQEPKLEKLLARLGQSGRATRCHETKTSQNQLESGKAEKFQAGVREESSCSDSGFSRWSCTGSAVCTEEWAVTAALSAMVKSTAALQGKPLCQVNLSIQAQQMNSLPGTEGFIFLGFLGTSWAQTVTELTPVWALVSACWAQSPPQQVPPEHLPALGFGCFPVRGLEWGIL